MLPAEIALLVVWVGLGLVALWCLILSLILRYHWRHYRIEGQPVPRVMRWYGPLLIVLFGASVLTALAYSATLL